MMQPCQTCSRSTARFLAKLVVLSFALLVVVGISPVWPSDLRVAQPYISDSIFGLWVTEFSKRVEARTSLRASIYAGDTLGGPRSLFAAVRSGSIDVALVPAELIAKEVPDFEVLSLPGLFRDADDARRVSTNVNLREILSKSGQQRGFVALGFGWTFWNIATTSQHIDEPQDLYGHRVRTASQMGAELVRQAGAEPVSLPYTEALTALQAGYVDSIMTTGLGWTNISEIAGVQSITWSPEFSIKAEGYVLVMNEYLWEKLPRKWQNAAVEAAQEASKVFQQKQIEQEEKLMRLAQEKGIEIIKITPKKQIQWLKIAKPIWVNFRKETPNGDLLLDRIAANR